MPLKIIIVEDQIDLQEELVYFLCKTGHTAMGASSGQELNALMEKNTPDLLLLDIELPDEDGISIARRLSKNHNLTIIMLTAHSSRENQITSFEGGADNFLVKPVNYRELQAVLDRANQRTQRKLELPNNEPPIWHLLQNECTLCSPLGHQVSLTASEFNLVSCMVRRDGQPATRREIIEAQGYDFMTYDERRIEVRISRLRKKIRDATGMQDPIKSEWGIGYIFKARCIVHQA